MKTNLSRCLNTLALSSGVLLTALALLAVACGSRGGNTGVNVEPAASAPAGAAAAKDQNACHLFTHEEVSALVGKKIVMADQTEAGETWSTCQWEDESGQALFILTVYWSNGKQEWETWRAAQGLGEQALKQAEGVGPGDVVKQGPVAGIGDAAFFSDLLPSLVLKGDVLFEMNLFFVPNAETKFAGLAQRLLAKIE
jgi:hypothetical protein